MGSPPLLGAVQLSVAWVLPRMATRFVGAEGSVAGVVVVLVFAGVPFPMLLVAVTRK